MSDGDVHQYFSAYGTVVEAFVRLHTALYDLKRRAEEAPHPAQEQPSPRRQAADPLPSLGEGGEPQASRVRASLQTASKL